MLPFILTQLSYAKTTFVRSLSMRKNKQLEFSDKFVPKPFMSSYFPKTQNQINYVKCLNDETSKVIVTTGPAGTGKTLFACLKAIDMLNKNEINKVIITRPVVTVEEELGFLPGNIVSKMDPWTRPIFDLFLEYYSKKELDNMVNEQKIEISPLAFMRGRTFKSAFIIADEMQNSSPNQMKMLTTRIGTNSKMVITGDMQQSDLTTNNGLYELIQKIKTYDIEHSSSSTKKMIELITLDSQDIERSEVVKKIIEIYDYKKMENVKREPVKSEPVKSEPVKPYISVGNIKERRPELFDFDALYRR
jgi:phosphate starvation-inducible PhoH-like protein